MSSENRCWIEFHDSVLLVAVDLLDRRVELTVDAYVHVWTADGETRRGTGWMQQVRIGLSDSHVPSDTPVLPIDIYTGELTLGAAIHSNLVPLPFRSSEATYLRLEFMDATVLELRGTSVNIEASGAARYVEALPADLWPGP